MKKILCYLIPMVSMSCMTWRNPGAVAENVGFIAFDSDLANPIHLGERQAQACYWMISESADTHGPEQKAYQAFVELLKNENVRYVTHVWSEHIDHYIFVPFIGGTSRCVSFYGDAYQ